MCTEMTSSAELRLPGGGGGGDSWAAAKKTGPQQDKMEDFGFGLILR